MARGTVRSPSQNAYRGAPGRTRTATIRIANSRGELVAAQVVCAIDAVSDPELVVQLHAGELNMVTIDGGAPIQIAVPIVYHDPAAELLVLILGDAHRHRELDERIAILEALRDDEAPVPAYAKDVQVVYGVGGLRALVELRAQMAVAAAESERRVRDAEKRVGEIERKHAELERRSGDVDRRNGEIDRRHSDVERRFLDAEQKHNELDSVKADLAGRTAELARERAELARERAELARARGATPPLAQMAVEPAVRPSHPLDVIDSAAFDRVEPTRDLRHGRASSDFGEPTADHSEPALLREPDPAPYRRPRNDTDDVITGSQQAVDGRTSGRIPNVVTPDPEARESAESFETEMDTGVVSAAEFRAAMTGQPSADALRDILAFDAPSFDPVAPEAAVTEVGGPDPRPPVTPANDAHTVIGAPPAADTWTEDETTGASIPPESDPLTTETVEPADAGGSDPWLEKQLAASAPAFTVEGGTVRLALHAGDGLAANLRGRLDVRVLLHRTKHYPLITVVVGPPAALRTPTPAQLAVLALDIGNDRDRAVLAALGRRFELVIDLIVRGKRLRRARLVAPLAENVGYILRAAEDHLRGVQAEGEPSLTRAKELVLGAGYDLLGVEHPEYAEFRDDKLAQLATAQHARRAIAMARRFARPSREDYLVCTRGFPLTRWRELRRHVLDTAVNWGLWMGPELAQVAVSEGLARSRRDLIVKLDKGGETLRKSPDANDVDEGATADNAKALAEEAKALGVELTKVRPTNAIVSDDHSQVSGSIGGTPAQGMPRVSSAPAKGRTIDQLIAALDDRDQRVAAAIELCERADPRAAGPVISTVGKLSRAEAVRVLGMAVKFGDAAKAPLLEGLKSSKAFLRHGSALALGLLRTEDGTQAVIDLLLAEPTEIWREVARAIGQVGPTALLALASTYGRLGDKATPAAAERVAWAMAHVAVRGGKAAIETMAGGHSVVAPVAKTALELHAVAANDHVRVKPGGGESVGRDVTVNRAFSRKFFEALEQGLPETGAAELEALDASSPMELLDEADLIEDEDGQDIDLDSEEIDEADLIQT